MSALLSGPEYVGERLRMARRERGLTQDQLGKDSGTNQAVIQKIDNGRSQRPRLFMHIAAVLVVNPAWLQFGEPWAQKEPPQ